MSSSKSKALAKGLGGLIGGTKYGRSNERAEKSSSGAMSLLEANGSSPVLELPVDEIIPNPRQPRTVFDADKLKELSESIKAHGVLQPLLVTKTPNGEGYMLLAGERRLRASTEAGLKVVPVRVLEATDAQRLEMAIIENVQREDLNPVDEARGYQALIDSFNYNHEKIAARVSKSRVTVVNSLRLLKLPEPCLLSLERGEITAGHARAILMLPHATQQEVLRKEILERQMTVREAEARAKALLSGQPDRSKGSAKQAASRVQENVDVHALEEKLTLRLGCKVRIRADAKGTSGKMEVAWATLDDLDRVLELLQVKTD